MSGTPPKGKKHTADASKGEQFVPRAAAPVITAPEETKPPVLPVRQTTPTIIRCKDCFWGQDVSTGFRRCHGKLPDSLYRNVTGYNGAIFAEAMWPRVSDNEYCAFGVPAA